MGKRERGGEEKKKKNAQTVLYPSSSPLDNKPPYLHTMYMYVYMYCYVLGQGTVGTNNPGVFSSMGISVVGFGVSLAVWDRGMCLVR